MTAKFDFKKLGDPVVVTWPVTVNEPVDGGKVETQTFDARFRVLTNTEGEELHKQAKAPKGDPDAWIKGWFVGLSDGDLTPDLLALMLDRPWIKSGLIQAYVACSQGVAVKN